ncbi:uncharacterized protein LOC6581685 isoform X2 [Drosophila mojavensis]|uniref:uncharacterized protein LOC6581685 isoform X2 n=1 Tax=Drosophila mojavensis TaxID=7230 RepID=UPI001CD15A30|nr:uncharacterized protein LOC6581685 isoform X2 [Drosophila mojavensis]
MSQLLRVGLLALLAALLAPPALVDATCGFCYGSHTCINTTTFRVCYEKKPVPSLTFTCPEETPICTQYGSICQRDFEPACPYTVKCGKCDAGQIFACTSLTTFGACHAGQLLPERSICPKDYYCSVRGAANGNPCNLVCEPDVEDSCDRVEDDIVTPTPTPSTSSPDPTPDPTAGSTAGSTPDPTAGSTSDVTTPTTIATTTIATTTTTAEPTFDPTAYCQGIQKIGNFAIPNDTVCTSFIYCFYRGNVWNGSIRNCNANNPYFNAVSGCGATRPSGVGCL